MLKFRAIQESNMNDNPTPSCRFLTQLIERGRGRTKTEFDGAIDNIHHGTCAQTGIPHLRFCYDVMTTYTRVALYMQGLDGEQKEELYDSLLHNKTEIDNDFGGADLLEWQHLDAKPAFRIAFTMRGGGYTSPENLWPEIQENMIDAMIRMEKVFLN